MTALGVLRDLLSPSPVEKTCPNCGYSVEVLPANDGVWHWCEDGRKYELT